MVGTHWFEPRVQTRGLGNRQYTEHEVTAEMSPVAAITARSMASARTTPVSFQTPAGTPRAPRTPVSVVSPRRTPRTPESLGSFRRSSQPEWDARRQSQFSQLSQPSQDGHVRSPGNKSHVSELSISVGKNDRFAGMGDTTAIQAYSDSRAAVDARSPGHQQLLFHPLPTQTLFRAGPAAKPKNMSTAT